MTDKINSMMFEIISELKDIGIDQVPNVIHQMIEYEIITGFITWFVILMILYTVYLIVKQHVIKDKNWDLLLAIIPLTIMLVIPWSLVSPIKALLTPELFIFDSISQLLK